MWRVGKGLTIGWMLLGLLTPARAEPQPSIDLRWEAPQGCPQENDVRSRIQKLLGSGQHDSRLRAEGTITRTDKRFRLDLVVRVRDLIGTRSIEGTTCEDLAGVAAVELGLLIHSAEAALAPSRPVIQSPSTPTARGSETSGSRADGTDTRPSQGQTSPAPQAPDGARPESKSAAEGRSEEPAPSAGPQRSWHALVQVPVLELGVGPLPESSRGIGVALGLEYASWQLQIQGLSWQRQNVPANGFSGDGVDVERVGAAFWGCREFRGSWVGFSPCTTVEVERVSATGTGPTLIPSTQHALGMALGVGAQGRLYLAGWVRVLVAVGGQIELSRPQISLDGVGAPFTSDRFKVYQFAPAALSIAAGLEWIL
jgi:hypothetical protein